MKLKNFVPAFFLFVIGILVAAGPFSFAHVCEAGEKLMKCHWSARVEFFLGLELALLALLRCFSKSGAFSLGIDAGIFLAAVGIVLVPTILIGVCGNVSMHCHSVTKPFLLVAGCLGALVALADVLLGLGAKRRR